MSYNALDYWEKRLSEHFSLVGTGHLGFSERYNRIAYARKVAVLDKQIAQRGIDIGICNILDIGSGNGFFIDYYLSRGALAVTGVDITEKSVSELRNKFPACRFHRLDIGRETLSVGEEFAIINAFDVLYHIVEDDEFVFAAKTIGLSLRRGGWVFITDALSEKFADSPHVRYRDLESYRTALSQTGVEIESVVPIMWMLSAPLPFPGGIVDVFAPLWYAMDSIYCPANGSRMSLLICRKK